MCVECCAINRDHAQAPDNAGEVRRYRPIAPEGPAAYFTDLPVEKMVAVGIFRKVVTAMDHVL